MEKKSKLFLILYTITRMPFTQCTLYCISTHLYSTVDLYIHIRLCCSSRKPATAGGYVGGKALNYDEVFRQSSSSNTTVYVGGTTNGDDTILRQCIIRIDDIFAVGENVS